MQDQTLKRCLQALASRPGAVRLEWRSTIGCVEVVVHCHGSDVSKLVGRGGKTLNAVVRLGRALYAPDRFAIPEVREDSGSQDEEDPFTYAKAVELLGEVCRAVFRRTVTVKAEEENVWVAHVDGALNRRTAAETATAVIDLFEAIGLTMGMRGTNRLLVRIVGKTN